MSVTVIITRLAVVLEARVLADETEPDRADWTVSLFADDHLGDAFVRRILVVNLIQIDEYDNVGVLLDGA